MIRHILADKLLLYKEEERINHAKKSKSALPPFPGALLERGISRKRLCGRSFAFRRAGGFDGTDAGE
ncbi:hypothetical protein GCWU000341_00352 [Oribacterium sp. oral taxon 078 str. F0262]|nr:hypothetical protein GCWU000341_00352 [Oribacterium sp. oral taxon 078 str. F0262]